MGIGHIWLIDPALHRSSLYRSGQLTPATHFGMPGEPIYFAIEEIEKLLD
jgi:hypothetical protein